MRRDGWAMCGRLTGAGAVCGSTGRCACELIAGRQLDPRVERVLFALVANRALEPVSKLAATKWVRERAAVRGLDER